METQWGFGTGGGGPALIIYVYSIFPLEFCYISRRREGGREGSGEMEGGDREREE